MGNDAGRDSTEDFDRRYRLGVASVRRRVEKGVLGADYGATSYTTVAQVAELAGRLRLRPGTRLLDLGAGSGWPGLHLAALTGCRVVLADRPADGLRIGRRRALADGQGDACQFVRATGERLPFGAEVFDAVTHTDVLC